MLLLEDGVWKSEKKSTAWAGLAAGGAVVVCLGSSISNKFGDAFGCAGWLCGLDLLGFEEGAAVLDFGGSVAPLTTATAASAS